MDDGQFPERHAGRVPVSEARRMNAPKIVRLNDYQAEAMRTAESDFSYVTHDDRLELAALGLSGESGEFADLVKKAIYHAKPLDATTAAKELGDILWYLALGAAALNLTLEEIAQMNAD